MRSAICWHDGFDPVALPPKSGRTLIVGSYITKDKGDRRALYADSVGVDMRPGPGVDLVADMEEQVDIGTFAHVECMSVLEHSRRPWLLASTIERVLEPGGTLYVSVPFNWREHSYPDDYFRMSMSAVRSLFPSIKWDVLAYSTHGGMCESARGIPHAIVGGYRYYARSVTCGFGVRR